MLDVEWHKCLLGGSELHFGSWCLFRLMQLDHDEEKNVGNL